MFRPRVIPVLLLSGDGLVKSVCFKDHKYIGDPINAVKLFNDLEADELIFLDILAFKNKSTIPLEFVKKVGKEANMPFAVGGGVRTLNEMRILLQAGAEKVIINSAAYQNPTLIRQASEEFGSSSIVVSMDVKRDWLKRQRVVIKGATEKVKGTVAEWAERFENEGAGELMITSVDHEGGMQGFDLDLVKAVSEKVSIPVIAHGGAGSMDDCVAACSEAFASAVAAGSLFVYQGPRRGVLINYPDRAILNKAFLS